MTDNTRKADSVLVSEEIQSLAESIDKRLEEITGRRQNFVLVVFTEGRANYVSNGNREEVRNELASLVKFWQEGMPDIPAHEAH